MKGGPEADTRPEMRAKPVDPKTYRFSADNYTPFGQEILDIRRAERKPVLGPNSVGDNLTWETNAFQAQHGRWYMHRSPSIQAMPHKQLGNAVDCARSANTKINRNHIHSLTARCRALVMCARRAFSAASGFRLSMAVMIARCSSMTETASSGSILVSSFRMSRTLMALVR